MGFVPQLIASLMQPLWKGDLDTAIRQLVSLSKADGPNSSAGISSAHWTDDCAYSDVVADAANAAAAEAGIC